MEHHDIGSPLQRRPDRRADDPEGRRLDSASSPARRGPDDHQEDEEIERGGADEPDIDRVKPRRPGRNRMKVGHEDLIAEGHRRQRLFILNLKGPNPDRSDRKSTRLNSSHGYIAYAV